MQTIGVVIVVPEPWGSDLQAFRERIGDPMADLIPPHITLLPPVGISTQLISGVVDHLATAAGMVAPFEVALKGTDSFRPVSPVVFVALEEGADDCATLEGLVRNGPLGIDSSWPYHPHVTVAHELPDQVLDLACTELAGLEASFVVDEFTLYILDPDGRWHPTHTFPLGSQTDRGED
ncbi:2'-5' RNA ligase family protein [Nocardioides sp. Kera G14]|uniref:2'-5' RNA ligase family protein n=1 Tax=Nocardioides sp. Kera G14 TaxID=2884264 RepID=UPI001D0F65BD|nr:2'-5' RNA ligase family protein [Nocardioides sp. Kera G14]UDY24383.1 2'-5' RNA ligase family protein [Nocardioides sp. Kera G14]